MKALQRTLKKKKFLLPRKEKENFFFFFFLVDNLDISVFLTITCYKNTDWLFYLHQIKQKIGRQLPR